MNEQEFASYVWVFWALAGLGILIGGLIYTPILMLILAGLAYGAYRLLGGK
jgi:hypothetical protein